MGKCKSGSNSLPKKQFSFKKSLQRMNSRVKSVDKTLRKEYRKNEVPSAK